MIDIYINKADAKVSNLETLTAGMSGTVYVRFNLSSDWKGLIKTAVFSNGVDSIAVIEEQWSSKDTCAVPARILAIPQRRIMVGLQGSDSSGTVLPAVMVSIGIVTHGTNATEDYTTDSSLPVWEQMHQELNKKHSLCSVRLEKNPDRTQDTYSSAMLRVHFCDKENIPNGAELHLYRAMRRRNARFYWVHPQNYDAKQKEDGVRWGYGVLVGQNCHLDAQLPYPKAPLWMPHKGFVQTEYPITNADIERGYMDIPIGRDFLSLLKPKDDSLAWSECGIVGLSQNGDQAPHLLQFRIVKNGIPVDETHDKFCFGLRKGINPTEGLKSYVTDGHLNPCVLYFSIR